MSYHNQIYLISAINKTKKEGMCLNFMVLTMCFDSLKKSIIVHSNKKRRYSRSADLTNKQNEKSKSDK
jgi:hypothetical protein